MNCLEIGGDAGRAEHVAAELDPEAGVGRAPARHAVGVDAVHRLVAGSNVGDRGSGASWCCSIRLLQSINSESIMAGRRCFISRSTSHVSTGIWLTNAAIV